LVVILVNFLTKREEPTRMVETTTSIDTGKFSFVGGQLCLDFTNTMSEYKPTPREDKLVDYADLVVWGRAADVQTDNEAQKLLREAAQRPDEASATLGEARDLRGAIHNIFSALAVEAEPDADDLARLNVALSTAMCHAQVARSQDDHGFAWDWVSHGDELDRMLWPVARSAADLLTSDDLGRVRECAGSNCGWLFLDMSRNHSRHWCDMRDCGNRAKVRRYYQRKREA
jgi:predicted RNA-binding Zn ribbon-like protein